MNQALSVLLPLPAAIDGVTPAWLTTALARHPAWHGRVIVTLDVQPLDSLDSLASAVYVANVGVTQRDRSVAVVRLLLKLHHPDPDHRDDAGYTAEAWFYREHAADSGVRVPATYVADYDSVERRLFIAQEYLSDGRIGSANQSLELVDLERVLASLATMHAKWWDVPALAEMSGVRSFEPVIRNAIVRLRDGGLDVHRFLDRFDALVDPVLVDYYATMPEWMERVAGGLSGHQTLIHLDCSAKNLFIPRDPQRGPVLFDWALFRCGHPALDVATLLCYSMDPVEHHRMPELVYGYHARLEKRGVHDFAFDDLWNAVRLACLWRMAAPVANAMVGTGSRDAHARTIIPRLNSAVLKSGALEMIQPS